MRVIPKSKRAKNRVREHTERFECVKIEPDGSFFVWCFCDTHKADPWCGWFNLNGAKEADFEVIETKEK